MSCPYSYVSTAKKEPYTYKTILDVLTEQTELYPDLEIIICRGTDGSRDSLTNKELKEKSQKLAGYLIRNGINKGDYVAICGSNSMDRIIAEVGIIAAGGIVVQLTTGKYDGSDIIETMKATNCMGLFIDQKFTRQSEESTVFQNIEKSCLNLSFIVMLRKEHKYSTYLDIDTILEMESPCSQLPILQPEDTMTVYVTSGSTGNPKLVEMSHMPHVNIKPSFTAQERPISYCDRPFGWIGGNIMRAVSGNEIRVYPKLLNDSEELKIDEAIKVMQMEKCNLAFFMPSFIQELLLVKHKHEGIFRLKVMLVTGYTMKASPHDVVGTFCDMLFLPYASTETHVISTNGPILPGHKVVEGDVGLPFPGVEVKIVDNDGQTTRRGIPGEICVRSNFISNGFHKSMKEADHFMTSNRWVKTGDLGIINTEGRIIIQGRTKDVICKGGRKYIPSYIEEPIWKLQGIANVMAIPVPDDIVNEEICLCFVSEQEITEGMVEKYCDDVFCKEETMLGLSAKPKYYIRFENFPVLPNGKPDKRKLKHMVIERIQENKNKS